MTTQHIVAGDRLQSIECGSCKIELLARGAPLPDSDRCFLTPNEEQRAAAYGSLPRREEFVRSRKLLHFATGEAGDFLSEQGQAGIAWPIGWRGSLTHKDGHVGISVLPMPCPSVGIDLEAVHRMKLPLENKVCIAAESEHLDQWEGVWPRRKLLTTIFSFKEALYKSHFPVGGVPFYFHDAEIVGIDVPTSTIHAELKVETTPLTPIGTKVAGSFLDLNILGDEHILTSCLLEDV